MKKSYIILIVILGILGFVFLRDGGGPYLEQNLNVLNEDNDGKIVSTEKVDVLAWNEKIENNKQFDNEKKKRLLKEFEEKIKNIVKNEKNHEKTIRNIFADWYPEEDPQPVEKSVSIEGQIKSESKDLVDLLEKAIEDERNAEGIYSELGERMQDKPESRILQYLAFMEREHSEILKDELERLKE